MRAEAVLGERSETQGLEIESVEGVAGGQQGAGQALAELSAPHSSWGCIQGSPTSLWRGGTVL